MKVSWTKINTLLRGGLLARLPLSTESNQMFGCSSDGPVE
jgi:hypothetical protein